jgi:hypothetical protein
MNQRNKRRLDCDVDELKKKYQRGNKKQTNKQTNKQKFMYTIQPN